VTRSLALLLLAATTPAAAQPAPSKGVELIPGVTFTGDGGLDAAQGPNGEVVATLWRPVQFGPADQPLAGRMDCRAAAWREPFSASHFDLDAVFANEEQRLARHDWKEMDRKKAYGPVTSTLDVVGRRSEPRSYIVRTYVAVRSGSDLVNLRRTCTFVRASAALRPDYIAMAARYSGFTLDLPPPATSDPLDTITPETLTDMDS
jgi:hypothetical protein